MEKLGKWRTKEARPKIIPACVAGTILALPALVSPCAAADQETVLHAFTQQGDGAAPVAGVTQDSKGNLYGTTYSGSVVYKLSKQKGQWALTALGEVDFGLNGLVVDAKGNLYGTTQDGPICGEVYELSPTKSGPWKLTIIHDFDGTSGSTDGCVPSAAMTFDAAGNLYGTTTEGGTGGETGTFCYNGCGSVYELSRGENGEWTEKVLHGFPGGSSDGQNPYSDVTFDSAGNIWGTTYAGGTGGASCNPDQAPPGCGTVFELTPDGDGNWTESFLYSFQNADTGYYSWAGPVVDPQGNVYGTVVYGGGGNGAVYELAKQQDGSYVESLIHKFAKCSDTKGCEDGVSPLGGLDFDSAGNLYGTTYLGGAGSATCGVGSKGGDVGCGTVFKLTPDGNKWNEKILYRFQGGADGRQPEPDRLVINSDGHIIGTTPGGGDCENFGCGVVFEVAP